MSQQFARVTLLCCALLRLNLLLGPESLPTPVHEQFEEHGHSFAIRDHLDLLADIQCFLAKLVIVAEDVPRDDKFGVGETLAELDLP